MWILRVRIVHNCVIGNRCRKFRCASISMPISNWHEKGYSYTSHIHTLEGPQDRIKKFLADLKKDPEIVRMEVSKNTVFLVQRRKTEDVITAHYTPKMFSVRPVHATPEGYEYCEFASWKKDVLMDFVKGMQQSKGVDIVIERFQNTKLDTISYPKVMPKLSERQHEAFQLAVRQGYYKYPRKIELQQLAKLMNVSVSTYQEHLRRAEEKLVPSYL